MIILYTTGIGLPKQTCDNDINKYKEGAIWL